MNNLEIVRKERDLFFVLRKPINFGQALSIIGAANERLQKADVDDFGCRIDSLFKGVSWHFRHESKSKMHIFLSHKECEYLQFNVYKGDRREQFEPCFDDEETAWTILIKPIEVESDQWVKDQNSFLFRLYPFILSQIKSRDLNLEHPLTIINRSLTRSMDGLIKAFDSFIDHL